jgi:hypothetical protein
VTAARAQAAVGLALLAGLAALPARQGPPPACPDPVRAGAQGALVAVRCDGRGVPLAGAATLLFGRALDVNRADARALEALPGIGARRAAAIVRARRAAPFCDVRELERVPGLGPATVARLLPLATTGRAPGCAGS